MVKYVCRCGKETEDQERLIHLQAASMTSKVMLAWPLSLSVKTYITSVTPPL